jgi:Domain of unknown function (DUF4410)
MRTFLLSSVCLLMMIGCAEAPSFDKAKIQMVQQATTRPVKPAVVYVEPFDLGATLMTPNQHPLSRLGVEFPARPWDADSADAATHLAQLSELLTKTVLDQLAKDGVTAQRFSPDDPLPRQGWLVSGKVLEVDEGNRLRRAMIGFGQGASDAQLYVAVSDLTQNNSPPFSELKVDSSTGNAPGAVVTMNPYVAAAKMVLARNPSEKDIQRAGVAIADRLKEAMDKAP